MRELKPSRKHLCRLKVNQLKTRFSGLCSGTFNSSWPCDCSPPGSSVHGISQERRLEWVAISFSRGSSRPRDHTCVSCIGMLILYHWATAKPKDEMASNNKSKQAHLQSSPAHTWSGLPWWLSDKEFACQCRRCRSNPWVRKSLWRSGNPLQCPCLGNLMGRGAWLAIIHGVAEELDTT